MDRFGDAAELVELLGDWTTASGPLYQRLAGALRRAVQAGDLQPGQRLPSERRLATLLVVSRATVAGSPSAAAGAHERRADVLLGFVHLACALICLKQLPSAR